MKKTGALLAAMLALSGCGESTGTSVRSAGTKPVLPMAAAFGKAAPQGPLIGLDARHLIAQFGQPRLDIRDRTVHKMQFVAGRCILDAYLYAPARGKEPVSTYIDTRLPGGADVPLAAWEITLPTP